MTPLPLHEFHARLNATFAAVNGAEVVAHYGNTPAEHAALRDAAGVIDLSSRSRLCLTGADRVAFLHGQVTNDVKRLKPGEGCYAALISAKGRMQSDLNLYALAEELLLDFEPGYSAAVAQRLEKYVIAADVQIVDAAPHYGLLSVQGPRAAEAVTTLGLLSALPAQPFHFATLNDATLGQVYLVNQRRLGTAGFDLFVPVGALGAVADKLISATRAVGGRACGWEALEIARIEAGIPRFGQDMDESNLPPEAGLEERAISYSKGCYIGQEIIARIRTYGQVTKTLRGLKLTDGLKSLPKKGDKLHRGDQEIGYVTSAIASPTLKSNIALAYLRREANTSGTELTVRTDDGESRAVVVTVPFTPFARG